MNEILKKKIKAKIKILREALNAEDVLNPEDLDDPVREILESMTQAQIVKAIDEQERNLRILEKWDKQEGKCLRKKG